MIAMPGLEFPPEQKKALKKARKLAWITVCYMVTVIVIMYLASGKSQVMKTAWIEDILSLIPSAVFLISTRICYREPTENFPYGFHLATSLAFLCAAVTLLGMGVWLFLESAYKLIQVEHPTIGSLEILGYHIWLGWAMIAALVYSSATMILGHLKMPVAKTLHDKTLFADAKMNKADLLTALAGIAGILGIGFGYWWADSLAAAIISVDIIHDGYTNFRESLCNLMNEMPKTVDHSRYDDLPQKVQEMFNQLPWVESAGIRMREEGHIYFGEVFLVPKTEKNIASNISSAIDQAKSLNWRIHDLVVMPIKSNEKEKILGG